MPVIQTHSTDLESGSSQYWSITNASQTGLDLSGDHTIEFWIKPETLGGDQWLVSKGNFDVAQGYNIHLTNLGKIAGRYSDDGSNSVGHKVDVVTDNQVAFNGVWVHIAVVFDISADSAVIYVNGVSVDVTNTGTMGATIYDNAINFVIGRRERTTPQSYFDGLIDDVRVWNDIRTQSEINDNKDNCSLSVSEAGLVSWWLFNDDGTDENANANNLTNNNSATFSTDVPYSCAVAGNSNFLIFM